MTTADNSTVTVTTTAPATATGGGESFTQSLDKLTFPGSPEIVAAFQIGWEVACLGDQCKRNWTEGRESAARKVIRIESALTDLTNLVIATDAVPAALSGQDYSAQLRAYGGIAPYKWSIGSGTVPDGLKLLDNGVISGTATGVATADDFVFTVQVTDSSQPPNVTQRQFTLPVNLDSSAAHTAGGTGTVDLFASTRYPTTTDMRIALNAIENGARAATSIPGTAAAPDAQDDNALFATALSQFDLGLRRAFAFAAAAAPLPQAGGGELATSTAVTSALGDAYELGDRLAFLCLAGETANQKQFTALFAAPGQSDVNAPDTYRIHSLLGSLRASFPASAGHAVARNIEDWSAWVNGLAVDTVAPGFTTLSPEGCQAAMKAQGKVWESVLTGQSRGRDYLVAASYPDAADHLLVAWTEIIDSMVRTLRKTVFGRTLLILFVAGAVLVAFAIAVSFLKTQNPSGAEKTVITIGGLIAALGAAAGIHVSRTQINSTVGKAWTLAESVLVDSEVLEAIAVATRRLPGEGFGGGEGGTQRVFLIRYRPGKARKPQAGQGDKDQSGENGRVRQTERQTVAQSPPAGVEAESETAGNAGHTVSSG